ncbi:DNA repair and recombination protein RAD54 [Trypanosoma cruzi]|nr:DNA repair and recombination protein RAD54 [Trypanosoma cruzi]
MPLFRHSGGSGGFPTGFRAPATAGIDSADTAAATLSLLPLRRRERTVIYPDSKGVTQAEITVARLAKRAHIEYHQPVREKRLPKKGVRSAATRQRPRLTPDPRRKTHIQGAETPSSSRRSNNSHKDRTQVVVRRKRETRKRRKRARLCRAIQ